MKTLLVVFVIILTAIGFEARPQIDERFYVQESQVAKNNAIVYESCYRSPVKVKHSRDFIEITTDSVVFKCFILREDRTQKQQTVFSLLAAHREQVFYVKEFRRDEKYYLVVLPVKLTMHNRNLGGYGLRLVISNQSDICESVKFLINK